VNGTGPSLRDPFDDELQAFLAREAERLAGGAFPAHEVAARLRRGHRGSPVRLIASVVAAAIGLAAVGLLLLVVGPLAPEVAAPTEAVPSPGRTQPPLRLPAVGAAEPCPVSTARSFVEELPPMPGDGPVHPVWTSDGTATYYEETLGGDWKAIDVIWAAQADFDGAALIRGQRLDGVGELRFGDPRDPLRSLRLDAAAQRESLTSGWISIGQIPLRLKSPGCYGIQVDAGSLSDVIVFEALPVADAQALLERPIELPSDVRSECPITEAGREVPFTGRLLGRGPIYVAASGKTAIGTSRESGGFWLLRTLWVADATEPGPVLVRGRRLDAHGEVRFGGGPTPSSELRFAIRSYIHTPGQPLGWRIFLDYLRVSEPGCYGLQFDTLGGSSSIVVEVVR
jgi:hypothetical protein